MDHQSWNIDNGLAPGALMRMKEWIVGDHSKLGTLRETTLQANFALINAFAAEIWQQPEEPFEKHAAELACTTGSASHGRSGFAI